MKTNHHDHRKRGLMTSPSYDVDRAAVFGALLLIFGLLLTWSWAVSR